jgi:hypothetical protein
MFSVGFDPRDADSLVGQDTNIFAMYCTRQKGTAQSRRKPTVSPGHGTLRLLLQSLLPCTDVFTGGCGVARRRNNERANRRNCMQESDTREDR